MSVLDKAGASAWYLNKINNIKDAIEVYEATQTDSAAVDVAVEIAELLGIGIPLWYVDKISTTTGLDRVFDSLKKNKSYEQYLKDQAALGNIRDLGLGSLAEWGLDELRDWIRENGILDPVFEGVNNLYIDALNWILRRDPLTLDLDGDGIETLPADGTVLFDHNGDGIKSGTGWVAPDDGLLVLDKDGNGLIETGNELFGDNTVKANGSLALNGFDALADLDSNADNRIDSNDAQFADLRIWRDLNSDGVSQANELFTLNNVGVAAVNLQNENIIQSVGNESPRVPWRLLTLREWSHEQTEVKPIFP